MGTSHINVLKKDTPVSEVKSNQSYEVKSLWQYIVMYAEEQPL